MSEALRLGVIGVGALAQRGILPHLSQEDVRERVRVQAVCDPVPGRAEEVARRYSVPRHFDSVEDLLDRGNIDAVTIASPIGLHYAHARMALERGKHVHVNKTMTTSVREADELIELADRGDLVIVASPGEVLRPQITRIRELVQGGAIGHVSWAICGCAFDRYHEQDEPERAADPSGQPIDPSWYFQRPGGGPMYDMTVYALHGLTSVLGPARRVTAMSGKVLPVRRFLDREIKVEVDDNTIVLLEFGGGTFAVAHGTAAGTIVPEFAAACYFGTDGEIRGLLLNGEPFDFPGRELTLDAPTWDWDAQMRVLPHVVGSHRSIPEAHVFEDIMQLVDRVLDGTPSPVTPEHARHVIDIIESAYRAAEAGTTQELTTTFEFPPVQVASAG
jgi:predicted dehydrogenase